VCIGITNFYGTASRGYCVFVSVVEELDFSGFAGVMEGNFSEFSESDEIGVGGGSG